MAPASKGVGAIFPERPMKREPKQCLRCGVDIRRYRQTGYCAVCINIAQNCTECGAPIAAFNKKVMCLPCQRARRKSATQEEQFDWWEDR